MLDINNKILIKVNKYINIYILSKFDNFCIVGGITSILLS